MCLRLNQMSILMLFFVITLDLVERKSKKSCYLTRLTYTLQWLRGSNYTHECSLLLTPSREKLPAFCTTWTKQRWTQDSTTPGYFSATTLALRSKVMKTKSTECKSRSVLRISYDSFMRATFHIATGKRFTQPKTVVFPDFFSFDYNFHLLKIWRLRIYFLVTMMIERALCDIFSGTSWRDITTLVNIIWKSTLTMWPVLMNLLQKRYTNHQQTTFPWYVTYFCIWCLITQWIGIKQRHYIHFFAGVVYSNSLLLVKGWDSNSTIYPRLVGFQRIKLF